MDADSAFDAAEPTVLFVSWFERMTVTSISGETVTCRVIELGEKHRAEVPDEVGYQVDGAHRVAIAAHLSLESVPVCVVLPPDFEVQDYTEFIRRQESLCDRAIKEVVKRTKPSSGHGAGTVRTDSSNCVGRRRECRPELSMTALIISYEFADPFVCCIEGRVAAP